MIIRDINPEKPSIQNVKQRFFALRNGIVADTVRRAGAPYRIIFGLNLPQLKEIATVFGNDTHLANELWQNATTRESRLIAPMLADASDFSEANALDWISSLTAWPEEADILCHSLLKHTPFAPQLVERFAVAEADDSRHYLALRLALNIVANHTDLARRVACLDFMSGTTLTKALADRIVDECDFLLQ